MSSLWRRWRGRVTDSPRRLRSIPAAICRDLVLQLFLIDFRVLVEQALEAHHVFDQLLAVICLKAQGNGGLCVAGAYQPPAILEDRPCAIERDHFIFLR